MEPYQDAQTGYEVRVLTDGATHTKPYFDTESTTPDDVRVFATLGHARVLDQIRRADTLLQAEDPHGKV